MPCDRNSIFLLWSEELAPAERRQVRHHLENCSQCRMALAELRMLKSEVGQLPEVFAPKRLLHTAFEHAAPPKRRWWRISVPLWQVALVLCLVVAVGRLVPYSLAPKQIPLKTYAASTLPAVSINHRLQLLQAKVNSVRPSSAPRSHRRFHRARTATIDQKLSLLDKRVNTILKARGRHRPMKI